jgi:hypothetical protein
MKKGLKRVYQCQVGKCYNAPSVDDCYGVHICDKCKLCTLDGMVVKTVMQNNIIYEVVHVSADEIILYSSEYKKLRSVSPYLDEFIKKFNILDTEYDDRNEYYY